MYKEKLQDLTKEALLEKLYVEQRLLHEQLLKLRVGKVQNTVLGRFIRRKIAKIMTQLSNRNNIMKGAK
jgi:ribosomal protein L29